VLASTSNNILISDDNALSVQKSKRHLGIYIAKKPVTFADKNLEQLKAVQSYCTLSALVTGKNSDQMKFNTIY
jgi:hypothetical protein